jgi:hypothetical protein
MYIFKTSAETFVSVIENQKHAFASKPKKWYSGETVRVSRNVRNMDRGEKQIRYIMQLDEIRPIKPGEAEELWPGNEGRWKYLVICKNKKILEKPFNLVDILRSDAQKYKTVVSFKKLEPEDERKVQKYLSLN